MFIDRTRIYIESGKGGDGHVSFRRELYVPNGGPDGGNGGKGGDVIFVSDSGLNTLSDFRYNKKYLAGSGQEGGKRRCTGKNGDDLILKVPEGTVIYDDATGKVLADMSGKNNRQILLNGGRGGKGNMNYATSTMQAPQYAQPGQEAQGIWIRLELKCIADVGLVGFPNVGKSTLLASETRARPKIANYPFTTLNPNLGVAYIGDGDSYVIADIPGLIEGASEGVGLGHDFLRHIERTRVLIHLVDAAALEGRDPIEDIKQINKELDNYDIKISDKPQVIALNKADLLANSDLNSLKEKIQKEFADYKVFTISAATGYGVDELIYYVKEILDKLPEKEIIFEPEIDTNTLFDTPDLPIFTEKDSKDPSCYIVSGPRVERMLGYTNLESEKGFLFFQDFMEKNGVIKDLKALGLTEGDTVRVGDYLEFEYFEGQVFEEDDE